MPPRRACALHRLSRKLLSRPLRSLRSSRTSGAYRTRFEDAGTPRGARVFDTTRIADRWLKNALRQLAVGVQWSRSSETHLPGPRAGPFFEFPCERWNGSLNWSCVPGVPRKRGMSVLGGTSDKPNSRKHWKFFSFISFSGPSVYQFPPWPPFTHGSLVWRHMSRLATVVCM